MKEHYNCILVFKYRTNGWKHPELKEFTIKI